MTLPFDQTLGLSHPFSVGKNVHSIIANPNPSGTFYADIAARDADTDFQVIENVGKAVGVTSPLSIFVLMSTGPAVWVQLGAGDPIDTFLELTDVFESTYTGEAGSLPTVNPGETGLSFNPLANLDEFGVFTGLTQIKIGTLTWIGNTFVDTASQIVLEGFTDNPLVMKGTGLGSPVLFNVLSGITTAGKFGDLGSTGLNLTASFGQIGWNNFTDLELAPQANAASDIAFFTPNAGLTSLVERMRIKTSDGEVLTGNLSLLGNTLATTDTNGNLLLSPDGTGLVDVTTRRIINVVDPTANQDAATKKYVDDQILTQDTFLELTDTPSTYAGQELKFVRVNMGSNALEFVGGVGDVFGPSSSLDNSVPTFDLTSGKTIQDPGTLFISGSNVGIGIAAPLFDLDIKQPLVQDSSFVMVGDIFDRFQIGFKQGSTPVGNAAYSQMYSCGNIGDMHISTRTDLDVGMIFYTGDGTNNTPIERMRIIGGLATNTKVGVGGIANPEGLMHLFDGDSGGTALATSTLVLETDANFQTLQFLASGIGGAQIAWGTDTNNQHGGIFYDTTSGIQFRLAGNQNVVCFDQNLRVGIGETVPDAKLHIRQASYGGVVAPGGTTMVLESNTNNFITMQQPDATGGGLIFQYPTGSVRGAFSYSATDDWVWSTINNTPKMTLDSTGHLRIGDATAPTAGLDVQGSHANKRTAVADANYTILADDYLIALTSITAARTFTFSDAEIAKTGKEWPIKDESGSVDGTDTITLATASAQTIDGATSLVLNTPYFDLVIYSDGSNLFVRSA